MEFLAQYSSDESSGDALKDDLTDYSSKSNKRPRLGVCLPSADQLLSDSLSTLSAVTPAIAQPGRGARTEEGGGAVGQRETDTQGKVRTFPHVEGNYATNVYIPVRLSVDQRQQLDTVITQLQGLVAEIQPVVENKDGQVRGGLNSTLAEAAQYHLSLSRTVPIKFYQIQPLVSDLRSRLKGISSFEVSLAGLEVFLNDDRSRTFVAVNVSEGVAEVRQIIARVDKVAKAQGLPTYYKDPKPHVSFAWVAGDKENELRTALATLKTETLFASHTLKIQVNSVECRTGQRHHFVWAERTANTTSR